MAWKTVDGKKVKLTAEERAEIELNRPSDPPIEEETADDPVPESGLPEGSGTGAG